MRASVLVLGLVVMVPLLRAADEPKGPPEGWKEYTPNDKSFTVWLPDKGGKRSERTRELTIKGTRVKANIVQVQSNDGVTFAASTILMPLAVTRKVPMAERLEILRDVYLEEVKGKVAKENDIKQGRVAGKEYIIETAKGMAKLQVYALGGRLYRASVAGSKEQVDSKDAKTFLDSYKLPEKATEPAPDKPADKPTDK
jgi:hypothetical protein